MATSLPVPLEADEGKTLVAWLRVQGLRFTHTPNETGHDPAARRRAIRMKQQGTSAGFPDYTIFIPAERSKLNRGLVLFVELKRIRGSTTSAQQREWIESIQQLGSNDVDGYVARGAQAAIDYIGQYVKPGSNRVQF